MANKRMNESWSRMKEGIQDIWGNEISNEDLEGGRRDLNKMIDIISTKTGKSKSQVRSQMMSLL